MQADHMTHDGAGIIGPILILDDIAEGRLHLAALFLCPPGETPPPIEVAGAGIAPERIARYGQGDVWRARFSLPMTHASYVWNGVRHDVAGDVSGDLRIAYVSCNGEETGDLARDGAERNAMWARLGAAHRERPFALLLHGGDQVYADEATQGHPLSEDWPERVPRDPGRADLASLRDHLRERFWERYAALYRAPEFGWLAARVPSLMQWDDHDICDGWGSLPRSRTYSPVGQVLFEVAREAALVFQHAARDTDLPCRFADPRGVHLGWRIEAPGLRLLAPDLRSERTRREVMGEGGWSAMEAEAAQDATGRTLILSSVPLLGPRLSILEAVMVAVPRMQRYEDDLRDQWQSRAHRVSWRRMLRLVLEMARTGEVTVLSGEIHLAARAEMAAGDGRAIHQLVASGIAHRPPPQLWARILGTLAMLGEDPLPDHPIRIRPLPGQRGRYVAERNFLELCREGGAWSARWHLEVSGPTPPLPL
jgi:hypothetical protein